MVTADELPDLDEFALLHENAAQAGVDALHRWHRVDARLRCALMQLCELVEVR